jgi:NAD kinase
MPNIARFVIWICSKFNKSQIELIVKELINILNNRNPEVLLKDDIKEKLPNYRKYSVDPLPPLTQSKDNPAKKNFRKS